MPAGVFDLGSNTDDPRHAEEDAVLRAGANRGWDKVSTAVCVVVGVCTLGSASAGSGSLKSNKASQFSLSFAVHLPSISRSSSKVGGRPVRSRVRRIKARLGKGTSVEVRSGQVRYDEEKWSGEDRLA